MGEQYCQKIKHELLLLISSIVINHQTYLKDFKNRWQELDDTVSNLLLV